ncbi:Crp/Fnr family transcriptional regulator [Spirochaeta cellobiosiphila]|uniref:Crp/Fnr family transcriptional regulator n=1 Tax=Spirochaeta cellobiosiphila TaxID=504483 RepID=UPI000401C635|nr:Crp/Fnr family transcriptional regulator [Spirochaeta cellobiosiphila]
MNKKYREFICDLINKIGQVPKEDREYFLSKLRVLKLNKNEHFIEAGDTQGPLGILYSGVLRVYLPDAEGKEKNLFFRTSGDFEGVYSPYFQPYENKIWFSTQAITNSEILYFTQEDLEDLKKNFNCWNMFELYIFQVRNVQMENRILSILTQDAQSRYELFLEEYPDLYNLIPQYQIASYIGINQVSLSRIRSMIK